jgi:ribosomal protein S6
MADISAVSKDVQKRPNEYIESIKSDKTLTEEQQQSQIDKVNEVITDKDTDANNQPEKQPVKQVAKPVEKTKNQIIAGLCKDLGLKGSKKLDYELFVAGKTGKPLTEDNFDYIIEKLNLLIK